MFSNKLAFTVLGAACIVAAGTGSYLALRQNATPPPPTAASTPDSASAASLDRPAPEPDAVVIQASAPKPAEPAPVPVPDRTASPSAAASPAPKHDPKPTPVQTARTEPAPVERAWPGSNGFVPAPLPAALPEPVNAAPARPLETVERVAPEPALLPEAPQKSYEELVVSADSVIGLQSETTVTSERARVEDRVEARVTRDVRVGTRLAIPAGSRALGTVSQVDRGGKFKERARIAIRFQTVVLADGTRLPISTDAVVREGVAPGSDSAKKMGGGAVAGTILGAIIGGGKGAALGGMVGAGAGAGVQAAGDRSAATLHAGEPMTIRLLSPVTVVTER